MTLLGGFLEKAEKNKGAKAGKTGTKTKPLLDETPILASTGITKKESAQSRQLEVAGRELAEKLAEALAPMAKENQRQSKGQGKKGSAILPDLKVDTREQAAREAGVSHGSLAATPASRNPEWRTI